MAACCLQRSHISLQLHTNQHFMLTYRTPPSHLEYGHQYHPSKSNEEKKVLSVGVGRFSHLGLAAGDMNYKDTPRYPQLLDPPIFSVIHFSAAMHASLDQSSLAETRKKKKKSSSSRALSAASAKKKKKKCGRPHQAPFFPVILRIIAPSFVSEVSQSMETSILSPDLSAYKN